MCTFLAGKNSKPTTTPCNYDKKNNFITTLCYKCDKDKQISEYMEEQSDCNSLIKKHDSCMEQLLQLTAN